MLIQFWNIIIIQFNSLPGIGFSVTTSCFKFFEKVPNINANDYNDHERAQKVIDSLKVQSLEMVFKKQSARTRALGYFSSVDIADGDTVIKSPSAVWIDGEDEQFFSISY